MNDDFIKIEPPKDIEPKFLRRLEELGGTKLVSELIKMYLERGNQLLETICNGIDTQDYSSVKGAAHSLISSAGNLGGHKVSDLAKSMENAAIDAESDAMINLRPDLETAQAEFQTYLKGALENL